MVIEYTGERISRMETKRRALRDQHIYIFTLNKYWNVDGSTGGSGAELINHSCDPNLYSMIRRGRILYLSKRPIASGEELTVDYYFARDVERVACRCGSARCRGTINVLR
jgi:SET domain-containing protein